MAQGLVSSLLLGQILLVLVGLFSPAAAVPTPQSQTPNPATQASNYWVSSIKRQGIAPFNGGGADYKVFRNVKDFGAKGAFSPISPSPMTLTYLTDEGRRRLL